MMKIHIQSVFEKIVPICYLVTLITFPMAQIFRLQLDNNINISLFDLSVLVTGFLWLVSAGLGYADYKKDALAKPIAAFLLAIVLSLVANSTRYPAPELFVAILYAVRWLLFVSVYFLLRDIPNRWKKRLPQLFIFSGSVIVILGYVQYFFYANLRNLYYLGWDEHLYRMFSTFLDPNFLGAFLVIYFMFLVGSRGLTALQSGYMKYLYWLLVVCTFVAIFLTTSRSAFIFLAVAVTTYLVSIGKKKILIGFVGISLLIFVLASPFFYLENINPFRVTSSLARVESAENAATIITNNVFFGVGFNTYRYAQIAYGYREAATQIPNHADGGTDNSLLFVFATTGLVGIVSYSYFLYNVYLLGRTGKGIYAPVLTAVIVGLVVNSMFINSLFYPAILYTLLLLISLRDYR